MPFTKAEGWRVQIKPMHRYNPAHQQQSWPSLFHVHFFVAPFLVKTEWKNSRIAFFLVRKFHCRNGASNFIVRRRNARFVLLMESIFWYTLTRQETPTQ